MSSPDPRLSPSTPAFQEDELLVRQCLEGDQSAWSKLVRKYSGLIFSIPVRRGFDPDTAADIFQSVCVSLLASIRSIREPRALAAWLIHTTAHACDKFQNEHKRGVALAGALAQANAVSANLGEEAVHLSDRARSLYRAISAQRPECRKLIELLFFSDPPISYEAAAEQLGLAKGSIGATRMRCLEKLRETLEEMHFR